MKLFKHMFMTGLMQLMVQLSLLHVLMKLMNVISQKV